LTTDACPYEPCPERRGELRTARWVLPQLVIRAELGGWTREGYVRQTAYKGLELDKDPHSVIRERPISPAEADRAAEAEVAEAEEASTARRTVARAGSKAAGRPKPTAKATRKATPKQAAKTAPKPTAKAAPKGTPRPSAKALSKPAARAAEKPIRGGGDGDPDRRAPDDLSPAGPDGLPWVASTAELKALESLGKEGTWEVGGEELKLTNLDKVLFPGKEKRDPPIPKRELIRYFARIGPAMLPHLADRPLNLHRYPNGALAPGFWQKDIPSTAPKWLKIWHETGFREREDREANDHLLADRVATLCWLGNQAAFEVHAWTSTIHEPWKPAFALVDIDPGEKTTWEETLQIARLFRTAFEHLGVRAYPKLTGRRGIQAWIPVTRGKYTYEDTSRWVERISKAIGQMIPDVVSWEWSRAKRQGKARLDYTQNEPIKTLVAPYSVRPAAGAPVSAPIGWDELDDPSLRPNRWTIRDIAERVDQVGDLFAGAQTDEQDLPPV
jgi:bifunctional non-homologous end joining protein LigD